MTMEHCRKQLEKYMQDYLTRTRKRIKWWKASSILFMGVSIFFEIWDLLEALFSETYLGTAIYTMLFCFWTILFCLHLKGYRNWCALEPKLDELEEKIWE